MKTKNEIRNQISHFYELKRRAKQTLRERREPLRQLEQPFQILDYYILALKWVLGYKVKFKGHHYWCFRCCVMHPEPTCPKCGNSKIMELTKR